MRSNWTTLVLAGTLGAFAPVSASVASDDLSSDSPSSTAADVSSNRQRALDLLKQARVEIQARRFGTARRLVKQAAELHASYGAFDLRPEQLLAEIDRSERRSPEAFDQSSSSRREGASSGDFDDPKPEELKSSSLEPRSPASNSRLSDAVPQEAQQPAVQRKGAASEATVRAIALLDRGLLAFDEKRYDDAEKFALQAAKLRASWGKYDYRPENLLEEIRRQREAIASRVDVRTAPVSDPFSDHPISTDRAASRGDALPSDVPAPVASNIRSFPSESELAPPPVAASNVNAPAAEPSSAAQASTKQASAKRSSASQAQAEALLHQALADLHAGRDALAQNRIERALSLIPGSHQGAELNASNRGAASISQLGLPEGASMPPGAVGDYYAAHPTESRLPRVNADDPALGSMHDPFSGDDPAGTQVAKASEQTMRESSPRPASASSIYLPRQSAAPGDEQTIHPADYEVKPSLDAAPITHAPATTKVQTTPDSQGLSPQISWLEKMSTPMTPYGTPAVAPPGTPGSSPPPGYRPLSPNGAPIAPPVTDAHWAPGRSTIPPADATTPPADQQEQPGFFRRMWNSMRGE